MESLAKQLRILESLVELLQTEIELQAPQDKATDNDISGQSVFLVHGHEEAILHEVARFLESLELDVIILREQPSEGRTIIEKFVDYSNVGFAVVLLTPDDKGGPINVPIEHYQPRARQNVLFELGYFLGKLSRRRVCALYREGVEIPSDYTGVLFIPIDSGGAWRLTLARELKAVGMDVDMNKAI
jgi:predicted nucleotide-binding protein